MEQPPDPNINKIFKGRYRLLWLMGLGAFGRTYLAEDMLFKRKVVLKLTPPGTSGAEQTALSREASAVARVDSPHVVQLYEYAMEDGRAYIVREYVEGTPLDALIRKSGALDIELAVRIAIAIAKGLAALHQVRILHRDVKPSNIIVPDNPDYSKLVDFGIVGTLQPDTNTTMSGQFFGTPLYMAPEQLEAKEQSPAADIYALAATLYEMLVGRGPFEQESLPAVLRLKFAGEVNFPADGPLPKFLVSLIRSSLSPKPEDRPQTAEEVIDQLRDFLEGPEQATRVRKDIIGRVTSPAIGCTFHPAFIITTCLVLAVLGTVVWFNSGTRYQAIGIIVGVLYAICGLLLAKTLRRWIESRRTEVEIESGNLLLSSRSRLDLGASLAFEVDRLINKVQRLDDKILATSLAIMVNEFQDAREGQMRQAAIMNVVQLLEKLTAKLSPWYVRHEKVLALIVSAVGVVSGITAVTASIIKIVKGQ